MAKTSIFSQKYNRRRKRKDFFRRLGFVILFLAIIFLIFGKPIMDKVNKVRQDISEENMGVQTPVDPKEPLNPETLVEAVEDEPSIFESFTFEEGHTLSLEILESHGMLVFKEPVVIEGYEMDLSPEKGQMVILDQKSQELYLAQSNGNLKNISYPIYKNSKGYTESKESILSRINGFVWAEQPRFLNENTVVYMSQLPWFDERRFLYIVELNPLSHRNFQSVFGTDVILKDLNEKGLVYEKAGKTYYFTSDYKILTP